MSVVPSDHLKEPKARMSYVVHGSSTVQATKAPTPALLGVRRLKKSILLKIQNLILSMLLPTLLLTMLIVVLAAVQGNIDELSFYISNSYIITFSNYYPEI